MKVCIIAGIFVKNDKILAIHGHDYALTRIPLKNSPV